MKRAVLYVRVSTPDQSIEPQLLDLRQMAAARGYEIVREYSDKLSGTKSSALDWTRCFQTPNGTVSMWSWFGHSTEWPARCGTFWKCSMS
jgi:hypothetical protein